MAIDIKYDLIGNPEPPTIILANRNGNKLGQLYVESKSVNLIDKLNEASEIAFTLHKYIDGKVNNLWDKVVNFKLIYCKEWDCWFEIAVELDEETETVKTVLGTQLGQAELSQIMLYDVHVNEEGDPNWDSDNEAYKNTILYDVENSKASLLHRLLEKAPHYSIGHIDDSLINIQRSFSFDNTSIYDAFQEVAEEIGCLFVFHSDSDDNGMPRRVVSVYDLQKSCDDCGYRGEPVKVCPKCNSTNINYYSQHNCNDCGYEGGFLEVCPDCNSTNIKMGYGEDTTIFVTSDELASGGIQLTTDTGAVKNCFKLEAGDDLMTATIRNRNPNGTDYIWYFSEDMKADMPDEMVERIESYDESYQYYYNEYVSELNENLVDDYNALVEKYKKYYDSNSTCLNCGHEAIFVGDCPECGSDNVLSGKNLKSIQTTAVGFGSLMEAYYNTIDFGWYLKSGLMPDVTMGKTDAEEQGLLLETSLPPLIAVSNLNTVSDTTTDNYVLQMARAIVNSSYKVSIEFSQLTGVDWRGNFTITNYSDETDTYTTATISRTLTDFDETYIKQKVEKILSKENTDNLSIVGLFEKDYDDFCEELKRYALVPLTSFHSACQACIDILIEQGVGNAESWGKTETGAEGNLHEKLYVPYYEKLKAIEAEMKIREDELSIILGTYNEETGKIEKEGLQTNIESLKNYIQKNLSFQDYFGENLWKQFCAYRREDKYSNSNYISDGLNNAELFEKAFEFYKIAENEIYKSSELQHSISATLNNLLAIPKFKSLVKFFKVGNWIRVQIDDFIYKLRLVEYEIDYDDFDNISVKFSDVAKIKNGISDLESILSNASSMASSYDSIQRQANLGNEAQNMIRQWLDDGLDASLVRIKDNVNEKMIIDNNGLIGRSYNEVTEEYSPEQIRITHNIMAYTDDDWASVKMAIGKHDYKYYDEGTKEFTDAVGYGVSADFVTAGIVSGSQIIGGNIYSDNYSKTEETGSYLNLRDGSFSFAGGKIVYGSNDNTVTLNDVTIEWNSTNAPEIKDISGLDSYIDKVDEIEEELNDFITGDYENSLNSIQDQIDKKAETWYQSTDPSAEWATDELKSEHIGDLWHDTDDNKSYIYVYSDSNNSYAWQEANGVPDSVYDAIDGKAQIFTITPTPPYFVGDLWVEGESGDIKHCIITKKDGESYSESDWVKSSKYTDDTALRTFINGDYAEKLIEVQTQIDGRAQTWYQPNDPSTDWEEEEKLYHVGDLWYDTDNNAKTYVYNSSYNWEEMNGVPKTVFDMADGSCSLYVSKPSNYRKNDIWILDIDNEDGSNAEYPKYEKGTLLIASKDNAEYSVNDWSEQVKYTNKLKSFIENDYRPTLESINQSIKNSKARSWYQEEDPSESWDITENHIGDLWYCCDESQKTYIYTENGWQETNVPKTVFDAIDGKRQIFVTKPTDTDVYNTGDLWILDADTTVNGTDYKKDTVLVANITDVESGERTGYNESDWIPVTTHDGLMALDNSVQAINSLNDIGDDSKITPTEKQQIKLLMQNITSEYNDILKQCEKYSSIETDDFTNAYSNLKNLVDIIIADLTTTTTPLPTGYPDRFTEYYSAKEKIISDIEDATKGYSDSLYAKLEKDMKEITDDLGIQIDGRIQTYYQEDDPSDSWAEEDYSTYEGDIWVNTSNGATYQWELDSSTDSYKWIEIQNEYLTSLAKSKAQIFTAQPTSYSKGDLIIPAETFEVDGTTYYAGKVYTATTSSDIFSNSHWTGLDYTNDDALTDFIDGDYSETIDSLRSSIDEKAETWYQSDDPSTEWTTDVLKNQHTGDLWYNTTTDETKIYKKTTNEDGTYSYSWEFMKVPDIVFDTIDGKATIYVTIPEKQNEGDLLIPSEDVNLYEFVADAIYRSTAYKPSFDYNSWEEVTYDNDRQLFDFIYGTYFDFIEIIRESQEDKKAIVWPIGMYENIQDFNSPTLTPANIGDLFFEKDTGKKLIYYGEENYIDVTNSCSDSIFTDNTDMISDSYGKNYIFVTRPNTFQRIGDLWVPESTVISNLFTSGKVYRCTKTSDTFNSDDWVEVDYTDDTRANEAYDRADEAYTKADSAYSLAEATKIAGETLVTGLGFQETEITGNYIITPAIAGGYLNIANEATGSKVIIDPNNLTGENYIFQVYNGEETTVGIDNNGNATFSGAIVGGSLLIANNSSSTNNPEPIIWTQDEDPADTERWNTDTKKSKHVGDLWYNTSDNIYYEYTSDYEWVEYYDASSIDGYTTYAEITDKGILNCKGANISGHINATSGTIGGCEIVNNTLTVGEANISSVSADAITAGTIEAEITINSPEIVGGSIYGGMFYATGQGADDGAAYYIYDSDYEVGNLVGYLSYDTNGDVDAGDAENRVLLTTLNETALKIQSDNNMSLEANGNIYMLSDLYAIGSFTVGDKGYGSKEAMESLPENSLSYGQVFFVVP